VLSNRTFTTNNIFHLFVIATKRWSQKGLGVGKPIDLLADYDSFRFSLTG